MRIRKSFFAVPLVVVFLTFLYPQTARADCPGDWFCPSDPVGDPTLVNLPDPSVDYSPGFDLIICYDLPCVARLASQGFSVPSVFTPPHVTPNSSLGCTTGTDVTLTGPAICAANTDGVLGDVAECTVSIKLPNVSCSFDAVNGATYSKLQSAKQDPFQVYTSESKVTIKNTATGLTGWPCPSKDATGHCTPGGTPGDFYFPIGTVFCSSSSCVAKILPATGDGISLDSLSAGQVLKAVEAQNFLSERGCKGPAVKVGDPPSQIVCSEKGTILTGGGEASVGVSCPEGSWSGTTQGQISPTASNNGFDLFGTALCPLNGIVTSSVELNGVPNQGCQAPPGSNHIRCFFTEQDVYNMSDCTPGKIVKLVARGDINVSQGGAPVTLPFFTNPGQPATCK